MTIARAMSAEFKAFSFLVIMLFRYSVFRILQCPKAEAFCRQCTEFICNDCVKLHSVLKMFTGHKIVTLQELKEGGVKTIPLKKA